jgi:hypothetical protein
VILVAPFLYGQSPQTHAAIAQKDLLLKATTKNNVPTTQHQTGDGEHHKVRKPVSLLR